MTIASKPKRSSDASSKENRCSICGSIEILDSHKDWIIVRKANSNKVWTYSDELILEICYINNFSYGIDLASRLKST
jgi:hypothetical protein